MVKWLYLVIRLWKCPHKFKFYERTNIVDNGKPIGFILLMKCEKCGRFRQTIFSLKNLQ